ncbi:hypothetical protein PsorP6_011369 [Peronosclerospora sorghi]|uniref:Uncharacterized protein n=1 Tax=Peronosclerospora sorghi TaxID=230839 RepID=A0ACC0WKT6_9STRA|nr:hypothetical protein PsorP6_011369 [Peronosclerospora sorghi]
MVLSSLSRPLARGHARSLPYSHSSQHVSSVSLVRVCTTGSDVYDHPDDFHCLYVRFDVTKDSMPRSALFRDARSKSRRHVSPELNGIERASVFARYWFEDFTKSTDRRWYKRCSRSVIRAKTIAARHVHPCKTNSCPLSRSHTRVRHVLTQPDACI